MTPPIKDLLPRLTPILKNRQEKVQENCIDLVGRIADRCARIPGLRLSVFLLTMHHILVDLLGTQLTH